MILEPAWERDYRSSAQVIRAWDEDRHFQVASSHALLPKGALINRSKLESICFRGQVKLGYDSMQRKVVLQM